MDVKIKKKKFFFRNKDFISKESPILAGVKNIIGIWKRRKVKNN